jgi:hypothetical protein
MPYTLFPAQHIAYLFKPSIFPNLAIPLVPYTRFPIPRVPIPRYLPNWESLVSPKYRSAPYRDQTPYEKSVINNLGEKYYPPRGTMKTMRKIITNYEKFS